LPDNYACPLPSVTIFGFDSDPDFRQRTGARVHEGVEMAQAELRVRAAALGISPEAYRATLQKRFRRCLEQLHDEHAASNAVDQRPGSTFNHVTIFPAVART
jgi:hypothetical protein